MIKSKISNSKEEIEKEIKNQQAKRERIKQAYINGSFTLEEHDKEVKYIDVANDMYDDSVLDDDDIEDLDLSKEKDDFER